LNDSNPDESTIFVAFSGAARLFAPYALGAVSVKVL